MKKTVKLFIMMAALAALPVFHSCQKMDTDSITNAIVTVIPPQSGTTIAIMLDENTMAYPVNFSGNDLGTKEKRALITFREPKGKEAKNFSSAGPQIFITWIQTILTKQLAENLGEEQNAESYGQDPVEILDDWTTLAEDGYMNICFRTWWGGASTHVVNMVYTPEENNPYCVTFYHDAKGDNEIDASNGLVAFSLDELPDTQGQTVDLLVKWMSFSGPKQATFKYRTRTR